jgi:site-specific recombinase XerD
MPLSPRTVSEYLAALRRLGSPVDNLTSFGDLAEAGELPQVPDKAKWEHLTNSGRLVMRAALRWAYAEAGQAEAGKAVAEQIPLQKEVRRVKQNPTHEDITKFLAEVQELESPWREVFLICVAVGFRREELLLLDRPSIQQALKSKGQILRFVRKGSLEAELPIGHVAAQFKTLLRCHGVGDPGLNIKPKAWDTLWEALGPTYRAAYERLKRKLSTVAKKAGCSSHWTPHVMRHAFASELARDGANIAVIQRALNHASYQTSLRYIHVDAADLTKYMKTPAPAHAPGEE